MPEQQRDALGLTYSLIALGIVAHAVYFFL